MRHTSFCGCSICSADVQEPTLEAEEFKDGRYECVITHISYNQGRWYLYYNVYNSPGDVIASDSGTLSPEEWNEWVKENKVER